MHRWALWSFRERGLLLRSHPRVTLLGPERNLRSGGISTGGDEKQADEEEEGGLGSKVLHTWLATRVALMTTPTRTACTSLNVVSPILSYLVTAKRLQASLLLSPIGPESPMGRQKEKKTKPRLKMEIFPSNPNSG